MRHCKAGAGAKRRQIQDKREDNMFVQLAASHKGLLEALEVQREHHGREKDEKLFGCVGVHRLLVVFLIIFFCACKGYTSVFFGFEFSQAALFVKTAFYFTWLYIIILKLGQNMIMVVELNSTSPQFIELFIYLAIEYQNFIRFHQNLRCPVMTTTGKEFSKFTKFFDYRV